MIASRPRRASPVEAASSKIFRHLALAITANQAPDHAPVARFRVRQEAALGELFGEVLALCAEFGLVRVGVVAVDGSKFAAGASVRAIRSYEQIAAEILAETIRIDAVRGRGPRRGARRRAPPRI